MFFDVVPSSGEELGILKIVIPDSIDMADYQGFNSEIFKVFRDEIINEGDFGTSDGFPSPLTLSLRRFIQAYPNHKVRMIYSLYELTPLDDNEMPFILRTRYLNPLLDNKPIAETLSALRNLN